MTQNRPYRANQPGWTDGPAKLTQALGIDGTFNRTDLCERSGGLWIESGESLTDEQIELTPRVGLNSVPEPWRSIPWRFVARKGMFDGA
jgi:DNA-3-methyladenine glycosylase